MNSTFRILAQDWEDEDLPLLFLFSFELEGEIYQLNDQSDCPQAVVMLPQGAIADNYTLPIVAQVTDSYDASFKERTNVHVRPGNIPVSWADSMNETLRNIAKANSGASGCGAAIDAKQALGGMAAQLNRAVKDSYNGTEDADMELDLDDLTSARDLLIGAAADVTQADTSAAATGTTTLNSSAVGRMGLLLKTLTQYEDQLSYTASDSTLDILSKLTGEHGAVALPTHAVSSLLGATSNIIVAVAPTATGQRRRMQQDRASQQALQRRMARVQGILVNVSMASTARMLPGEDAEVLATRAFELSVQRFGNDTRPEGSTIANGEIGVPFSKLQEAGVHVDTQVIKWRGNPFAVSSTVGAGDWPAERRPPAQVSFEVSSTVTTVNILGVDVKGMDEAPFTVKLSKDPSLSLWLQQGENCSNVACVNTLDVAQGDGTCEAMLERGREQREWYPKGSPGYACETHFCPTCPLAGYCNRSCDDRCANDTSSSHDEHGVARCVLPPESQCSYWDETAGRWRLDGVVIDEEDNFTTCSFAHLTDFASAVGPPAQTNNLASLRDTFDVAAFAKANPVGLALSIGLLLAVLYVSYHSTCAHVRHYAEHTRQFIRKRASVREFAQRHIGIERYGSPTLLQRVITNLRLNWTLGSMFCPLDGDPYNRSQRMLVILCTMMLSLSVSVAFFKPQTNTRQVCEGQVDPTTGYERNCTADWGDSASECTCKTFDCASENCDCSECYAIAACLRIGCQIIEPNGFKASVVIILITMPLAFTMNRLFTW